MGDYLSLPLEIFFTNRLHRRIEKNLIPRKKAKEFYRLMGDVDTLFQEAGITYWVDGGTLLGSVRNRGFVATDDDLDICVFKMDEKKLTSIAPKLKKKGWKFEYWPRPNILKVVSQKDSDVWLDIFFVRSFKNKVHYFEASHRRGYANFFHYKEDLWPLKRVRFGPIYVMCPNNPLPYLKRGYGKNWESTTFISKHKKVGQKPPLRFSVPLFWSTKLTKPAPW